MLKFRLESVDAFLILEPRWLDLGTGWQIGLLGLLLLLPLGLILWLSRYELRLVPRRHACGLLALRLLFLLVLWFVVGLQPQLRGIQVTEKPSRVRIAIDLSTSMDVADLQRTPAEKLRLARALKLRSEDAAPDEAVLAEWIAQYESGRRALDWIAPHETVSDPTRRDELISKRRRWHDETLAAVDKLSRKDIVAHILAPDGLNLLRRLQERHVVEIVGFHQDFLPALPLARLAAASSAADVLATDLRLALAKIPAAQDPVLLGILLFSDGRHNLDPPKLKKEDDPTARAEALGIPIFPVVIGSREPPNDLMILDVQAPREVLKDALVTIDVRCKVTNLLAEKFMVEMQWDGKPARPEHRLPIAHDGKDNVYTVSFQARMDEAGVHTIHIKTSSKNQKEITLANNEAQRIIRVAEDRGRVLLVDGEARWEYHYLANALARDPALRLDRVVFSQPRLGLLKEPELEKLGYARTALPAPKTDAQAADPLWDYDCILLGDVTPAQLPLPDRRRLERYVARRGGTLILIAGKRDLPLSYVKLDTNHDDPLVKMFPATGLDVLQNDKGFALQPSAEGMSRPFMKLEPDPAYPSWPDLPRHYWGILGKRKPAATVLLAPLFDDKEIPAKNAAEYGIMFQQNYGSGKVVFVGLDSTWRWRYRTGDAYHHRFWGQLARWAAADRLLPAGNRLVRFGPRLPAYSEGEEVELQVRIDESLPPLKSTDQAWAKLYRRNPDGTEQFYIAVPLTANERQKNLLEGRQPHLPPGVYRMELDIPAYRAQIAMPPDESDARPTKDSDLFRVSAREQKELLDLSTNIPLLQSLANRSDGKLYSAEDVELLLERLARRIERTEHREDRKPWQDEEMVWWLLGLLLSLLTLEWGWRKYLELP